MSPLNQAILAIEQSDHPLARKIAELMNQSIESGDSDFMWKWRKDYPDEAKEIKEFIDEFVKKYES